MKNLDDIALAGGQASGQDCSSGSLRLMFKVFFPDLLKSFYKGIHPKYEYVRVPDII